MKGMNSNTKLAREKQLDSAWSEWKEHSKKNGKQQVSEWETNNFFIFLSLIRFIDVTL